MSTLSRADHRFASQRLRVVASESSTIGTLLDVAQYLTDQLQSSQGKSTAHLEQLSLTLEQTLTLAVSQLSLALYNRDTSPTSTQASSLAQKEVDAGLGRDVESAIVAADSCLQASDGNASGNGLLRVLQGYVERFLLARKAMQT